MEEIYTQIANLGFPIVVSMYLLIRIEGKLERLTSSIIDLSNNISKLEKL
ncbi:MAG: YvrJ family protein [Anaeromicrobium sp.]|nr:YvrJ family protein [Anaeromicrobium sp.]MCT4595721.1 YvrJ family protein [Anaeromicrobium sp.]